MKALDEEPAHRLLQRHQAMSYPVVVNIGGVTLYVDEGVFCPSLTNTSPFLLEHLPFPGSGYRVADMFSGSGVFAVIAATRGSSVVAVDTSPAAVDCVQANARRSGVAGLIDVRQGTCRTAVAEDEKFDLVIANPPLLPGIPDGALETAIYDPDLGSTYEFLEWVPQHLRRGGCAFLLTSDVMDRYLEPLTAASERAGLTASLVADRDVGYEVYRIHRLEQADHQWA